MKWIAALAFMGVFAASCAEMDESYDGSFWKGYYVIQTSPEESTGIIEVMFERGSNHCAVAYGEEGYCVMTAEKFEARWSRKNRFALYSISGEQALHRYSGSITGDRMTLTALNCDSVADSFELFRYL